MTLDDLSISEQHEYDIYADSFVYDREYQVQCQYCPATAKGTWEQLEHVKGWLLAKRETCPTCAAEPEAENEIGKCDDCGWDDRLLTPRGDKRLCQQCIKRCENCGSDTYLVNGRLCEWCDEQAVAAIQPYTAAMGGMQ